MYHVLTHRDGQVKGKPVDTCIKSKYICQQRNIARKKMKTC